MKIIFLLAVFVFVNIGAVSANLVTFDFATGSGLAGADLDNQHSGSTSVVDGISGVTLTLTATAGSGGGSDVFNQTGTSSLNFGINAFGSGDDTDAIDAGTGSSEFATFSFSASQPVSFVFISIDFDRFTSGGNDEGSLVFSGGSTINFDSSSATNPLSVNEVFASGQVITLSHVAGNGFGIEQITIDITAVPEPSAFLFGGLICGVLGLNYSRQRKQS